MNLEVGVPIPGALLFLRDCKNLFNLSAALIADIFGLSQIYLFLRR